MFCLCRRCECKLAFTLCIIGLFESGQVDGSCSNTSAGERSNYRDEKISREGLVFYGSGCACQAVGELHCEFGGQETIMRF